MSLFDLFKKEPIYCIYYEYNINKGKKQGKGNLFFYGDINSAKDFDNIIEDIKNRLNKEAFVNDANVVIVNMCKVK